MGRARGGTGASRTSQLLLVALGAVAGLAIGMAVADRAGGMDGLMRRRSSRRQRRHQDDGWRGDERRSQTFDAMADDDSELAPEAISHLHLRGRYPEPAVRTASSPWPSSAAAGTLFRDEGDDDHTVNPDASAGHDTSPDDGDDDEDPIGRGPGPEVPAADDLELRVLEVFRNDPLLATRNIDIGADHHGRVELTGWVEDASEVAYALTLVRGIPQVSGVLSNLMIRRRATG
jgi:hypothetical protein